MPPMKSNCDSDCKMWCLASCHTLGYCCFTEVCVSVWAVVETCLDLLASPCGCCNHVFLQGIFQLPAAAWLCWLGLLLSRSSGWSFETVIQLRSPPVRHLSSCNHLFLNSVTQSSRYTKRRTDSVPVCCVMLHMTETVSQNWNTACLLICCLLSCNLEMISDSP